MSEREKFEAWAGPYGHDVCRSEINPENYRCQETEWAWDAWQAARRAEPDRVSRMDVLSLSEAARCLGVAQAKNDADAIASWKAESLRLESAICAKAEPEKVEPVWISVSERLPENSQHVLVSCSSGLVTSTFFTPNAGYFDHEHGYKLSRKVHGKWSKHFEVARQYGYAITHWQPMPKAAPQQEQSELAKENRRLRENLHDAKLLIRRMEQEIKASDLQIAELTRG